MRAARVLTPAIRMQQRARTRPADGERAMERRQHELLPERRAGGPADHAPRREIENDGEIQPALAGRDVGDVTHPAAIRRRPLRRRELPRQRVRRDGMRVPRLRRHAEAARRFARSPSSCISRATRCLPHGIPRACSSACTKGAPKRRRLHACTARICSVSCTFARVRALGARRCAA